MLFILDHCTDAEVGRMLRRRGHRCETAGAVGLATADDNSLAVYADDHDAVLISHDAESAVRRRENTFGRHVQLDCPQPHAVDILENHLEEVVELVDSRDAIVIKVSRDSIQSYPRGWT